MPTLTTPSVQNNWKAVDFRLKGTDGKYYTLSDVKGPHGLLVMFICNHCPFVRAIATKIARDTKELASLGVGSIAIMSNDSQEYPEDSFENMRHFHEQNKFTFPYVIDETQNVAQEYDAVCTPDFFGFDNNLQLRYRGRLDKSGMKRQEETPRELFLAMKMIAETAETPPEQHPSVGCSIKWRSKN